MPSSTGPLLGRRSLLAGLAALPVVLAGCGQDAATPAASGSGAGSTPTGFSFTDARGKVIDLATLPTVVVAQSSAAAALWDAGFQVKGAYGELTTTDGQLNYQAGDLDLSQVSVIGETYGQFDVEKYAALGPQLLIDLSFDDTTLWYVDAKVEEKISALAPTLGVHMLDQDLLALITAFTALAQKLGAAPDATTSAKAAFETAAADLKAAITGFAGKKVLGISIDTQKAYVANAAQHPDLAYLKTLGATFVDHKGKATDYFTEISLEALADYPADLILTDARNPTTLAAAKKLPIWQALPAVKAGKVVDWKPAAPYSYAAYVDILKGLQPAFN